MDFISIPITVGIVFFGTYKLFELFVKRRERLVLIEKLAENPAILDADGKSFSLEFESKKSYWSLKIACLLIGIGLGILAGFLIHANVNIEKFEAHRFYGIVEVIYGASVFIFGGLGLLLSFILEMRFAKQDKLSSKR